MLKIISKTFFTGLITLLPVIVILVPVALVLKQPDLGTAILLLAAGGGPILARRRIL